MCISAHSHSHMYVERCRYTQVWVAGSRLWSKILVFAGIESGQARPPQEPQLCPILSRNRAIQLQQSS